MHRLKTGFEIFIQVLIFYSLTTYFVELEYYHSENSRQSHPFFLWSERFVATIFTIEYLVRWGFAKNKIRYPFTPYAIIDLLAILPFYIGFAVDLRSLRLIRTLRVLRLFKFTRYNSIFNKMYESFFSVRKQLQIIGLVVVFFLIFGSTAIYEVEREAQPENFGSYSDAVWWCLVSLTTVGYGDLYPVTDAGRVVAVVVFIAGLGIFGTFVSLIGSAFTKALSEDSESPPMTEEQLNILAKKIADKLKIES